MAEEQGLVPQVQEVEAASKVVLASMQLVVVLDLVVVLAMAPGNL